MFTFYEEIARLSLFRINFADSLVNIYLKEENNVVKSNKLSPVKETYHVESAIPFTCTRSTIRLTKKSLLSWDVIKQNTENELLLASEYSSVVTETF